MKDENRFYVYAYLDPRKPGQFQYNDFNFDYEPFYIGKGNGYRHTSHLREAKHALKEKISKTSHTIKKIIKILKNDLAPIIIKVEQHLQEKHAYEKETLLVSTIGRDDLGSGPLTNKTNGGEGVSGHKWSEEKRQSMIKILSGENNYWYGKGKEMVQYGSKWTKERTEHMSTIMKGERNAMFNNTHTEEARKKLSESHKGITSKKYKLTSPTGEIFYTEHGLTPLCEKYNLRPGKLSLVAHNKRKHHKGWKCEFIDFVPYTR